MDPLDDGVLADAAADDGDGVLMDAFWLAVFCFCIGLALLSFLGVEEVGLYCPVMRRSAANSTLYPACERHEERSFSEKEGQKLRSIVIFSNTDDLLLPPLVLLIVEEARLLLEDDEEERRFAIVSCLKKGIYFQ